MLIKLDHFPRDENIWNHHPSIIIWHDEVGGKASKTLYISHRLHPAFTETLQWLWSLHERCLTTKYLWLQMGEPNTCPGVYFKVLTFYIDVCMCKKKPWIRQQTYFTAVQDLKAERCAQTQRFPMLQGLKVSLTHESAHLGKATCCIFQHPML